MGKAEGHVPERFLDKHGSHSTNAQLQEQNFAVFVFQYVARNFFVLFFIFLSLQEIPISSHPGESLAAAVGAPGNEIRRNLRVIPHSGYHISHRLYRIPSVIGTTGGTLEEPVISLDLCHLLLRVEFDKLGILVGGEDEEVLALQQSV